MSSGADINRASMRPGPSAWPRSTGFRGLDHKAFDTRELAEEACHLSRSEFLARHPELKPPERTMQASSAMPASSASPSTPADAPAGGAAPVTKGGATKRPRQPRLPIAGRPDPDSYAVDAACSGNPGPLEYRCVYVATGAELFKQGPFANGTNNIGEFLAIVHALALFKKRGIRTTIYSDSVNAIVWVRRKTCRTQLARRRAECAAFRVDCPRRGVAAQPRVRQQSRQVGDRRLG